MRPLVPALALLGLGVLTAAAPAPRSAPRLAPSRPRVEVAFVLDTTGSMGGLIEGAKRRIWSIARRISEGRPRPDLRLALVGYRDRGDQYVTLVHDFSADMDDVYARLMAFRAEGGGDTPEHVSAALHDAVHSLAWSTGPALRVIFLVGDAPPHVDYQDGYDYRRHAQEARQRGIAIETVECGGDPETARVWQEIAGLADGHFARIDAAGGMPASVTPADAELARLNAELSATVVAAGSADERSATGRRLEGRAAMPAAVAAEAASYFAKAERLADKDLVDLPVSAQRQELNAILARPAEAPKPLRGKTEAEALAYLEAQKERRQRLQDRILELQKQRDAFLKQVAGGQQDGFDAQVVRSLRARAAALGIRY